jgi:predicted cupin superfamily sugar epimerase
MSAPLPADPVAAGLARALALAPHPEGGWYREVWRSPEAVVAADGRRRAALTVIHYLLAAGERSRWHRVASDEHDAVAPLHVVPAGTWQAAEPSGPFALAACDVAPGFDFADFAFLDPADPLRAALATAAPDLLRLA